MSKQPRATPKTNPVHPLPEKGNSTGRSYYQRFGLSQRIEHIVMLTSFTILGVTGLIQKFAVSPLSQALLNLLGGIENTRAIHHVSSIVLMAVSIFHLMAVFYRIVVLRTPWTMLPVMDDFKHLFQDIGFYLGLRRHRAFYGRFTYAEKVEYLAVIWGTVVMAITGFMMWNPIATTRFLSGEFIPAAKAAHGGEAILAVLAIILWHFYHVHLKTLNKSMFNGNLTREQMEHEHPAELAEIEAGKAWQPPAGPIIRKRQRFFFPAALVMTAVLGFGLVRFITLEQTATTTLPVIETVQVYVPATATPRPTPAPTLTLAPGAAGAPVTWDGQFTALFRNRCSTCHGKTSVGGLSLETYQSALKGGDNGPAIVPGNPDQSLLVQKQSTGDHPGQLTIDELNQVIDWIKAGAAEK